MCDGFGLGGLHVVLYIDGISLRTLMVARLHIQTH